MTATIALETETCCNCGLMFAVPASFQAARVRDKRTFFCPATAERRRANGYKGHATRITKRAQAGMCPCCRRTFAALGEHMRKQHPDFTPLELSDETNGSEANG